MASAGHTPVAAAPAPPRRDALAGVAGVARKLLGLISLAVVAGGTAVIVSDFASRRSVLVPARLGGMPPWLRGPLRDAGYVLPPSRFGYVFLAMTAAYLVALLCAPALRARWIVAAIAVIHATLLLGPPIFSSDVFGYLDWARMGALHGLNPYSHDSGSVVSDAVYPFVRWHSLTSPYGPAFTLLTYAIVPLGLAGSFWALKVLTVGASLGCVALIYRICETLDLPPKPAILLYGLNPAVIVYAVGGFHNDVLMMLPMLGGIYLVVSQRERAGAALAASAVAIKASAGLIMPFLLLGAHERRRALTAAVMTGAAVLVVGFIAFGTETLDFLNVLGTQQKLNSGSSVIAQLGSWLGWSGSPTPVRLVASAVGGGAILVTLYRTLRGKDWVTEAGWATLALMVTSSWLLAWYIVWLVPLAAVSRSRLLQGGAVGMTLFVILVRVVPIYD